MSKPNKNSIQQKNKRLLLKILCGVIFMFGFAYLLVPLYTLVCKQAGINGRSSLKDEVNAAPQIDQSRIISVKFTTVIHGDLQFQFRPLIQHMDVHPGETKQVYFYAENDTGHPMTIQAIPSIAPSDAAKYLKKTQCFCFTQQTFNNKERVDMPVIFHIDPEIPKNITYLTLNYTLFDASGFIKSGKHFTKGRIEL